jgi:hypothetical protein
MPCLARAASTRERPIRYRQRLGGGRVSKGPLSLHLQVSLHHYVEIDLVAGRSFSPRLMLLNDYHQALVRVDSSPSCS